LTTEGMVTMAKWTFPASSQSILVI